MSETIKDFKAKVAYVSGASRGVGKGIAKSLARDGYNLFLTCQSNIDILNELAEELKEENHIEVMTSCGDVSDYDFVKQVGLDLINRFGRIDVVVNNAGISWTGLLTDMSPDEWKRTMDVNLTSLFYSTKVFAPYMISKKSGSIINISSMWGSVGASCEVAYSASKGGVNAFTKALAKELAPSGISVNALALGVIDTDMNAHLDEEEREALAQDIPAGRFAQADEIGEVVLNILKSTSYLTGQIIGVDGGYI